MSEERIQQINIRLRELTKEKESLLKELAEVRANSQELKLLLGIPVAESIPTTSAEKLSLFLALFKCRESVFPKLWENSGKGTKGYSPACRNEWIREVCEKPRIKCSACTNQAFARLDENAVKEHLQGRHTIGTYAIREDDSCTFVVADFDGDGGADDVRAYKLAAREMGIAIEVERSRSGNGGHAWLFFAEPLPARLARQLATIILSRASAARPTTKLETYDRFFPNQDFLPKGGFGNLIALPLQKIPREHGHAILLDDFLAPASDQWALLSRVRRLTLADVEHLLHQEQSIPQLFFTQYEHQSVDLAEKALDSGRSKIVLGSFAGCIEIEISAQLLVKTSGLPASIFSALKRTATFANPKFFELERLRFSTWQTPRFIFCGEEHSGHLLLPRGALDACRAIAKLAGSSITIADKRPQGALLNIAFNGVLSPGQQTAVDTITEHDIGVLVAPPGAGKTVMGCALIAKRKMSTLILVHRMPLLEQWRHQVGVFLGLSPKEIGIFGGQRKKATGNIDIGMLQTFSKMIDAEDLLNQYDQIIIDECHHIPAVSFENVLKKCRARHVVGLTATPYRKDGHQAIIHMQCGPIRHEMKDTNAALLMKKVIVRETSFKMPPGSASQPPIHEVWESLVNDQERSMLIAQDIASVLEAGRFPLVISERTQHLELLLLECQKLLKDSQARAFVLIGGLGKKARAAILSEIQEAIRTMKKAFLLATGSFIGEGFDLPELDTLMIAMPVSFKGKLIQYAGRLHRTSQGKKDVLIYDYLDTQSGLTVSMFKKRLIAYKKMEYRIDVNPEGKAIKLVHKRKPSLFGS